MDTVKLIMLIILMPVLSCQADQSAGDIPSEYVNMVKNGIKSDMHFINENINRDIELVLSNHSVPYGFAIAAECSSGRIIAMKEYSARGYKAGKYINDHLVCTSLFKTVPLAAAIGNGVYKPRSILKYRGSKYSELKYPPRQYENERTTTLAKATAFSNNAAYGNMGLVLGKERIVQYAEKFLFNDRVISGIRTGYIDSVSSERELKQLAAGLDFSYLTPLHGLMIAIALGNEGVLAYPRLTVSDLESSQRIISKTSADYILEAMSGTTQYGTSAGIFRMDRKIADRTFAKTGSLHGSNPRGYYNWFMAVYKGEKQNYAVIALVVNDPIWEIKASYLGFKTIQFIRKYEEH
ncbi:MAG: penicillin-binding transpeptidase domain-containing protein [bacterium]